MLTQRMSEHKRAVKNGDNNNALAAHVKQSSHNILWDKACKHSNKGRTLDKKENQGGNSHQREEEQSKS